MRKPRSMVIGTSGLDGRIRETTRRVLIDLGVEVLFPDDLPLGASWANGFYDAIKTSDFLVVDITRPSPNVMYELGLAHAMRKPTILMVMLEEGRSIPSDLAGSYYIVYEPDDLKGLTRHLQSAASEFMPKEAMAG